MRHSEVEATQSNSHAIIPSPIKFSWEKLIVYCWSNTTMNFCRTCIQTLWRMYTCRYFKRYHRFHKDLLERIKWRRSWWQELHINAAHDWIMILIGQWNCWCVFHIYLLFILKLWKYTCSSIVFTLQHTYLLVSQLSLLAQLKIFKKKIFI